MYLHEFLKVCGCICTCTGTNPHTCIWSYTLRKCMALGIQTHVFTRFKIPWNKSNHFRASQHTFYNTLTSLCGIKIALKFDTRKFKKLRSFQRFQFSKYHNRGVHLIINKTPLSFLMCCSVVLK